MTPLRKIDPTRRNAQRSTGPKTQSGKQRSSQNAVRHGLTAETVIGPLEDPADYRAFEQAVTTALSSANWGFGWQYLQWRAPGGRHRRTPDRWQRTALG